VKSNDRPFPGPVDDVQRMRWPLEIKSGITTVKRRSLASNFSAWNDNGKHPQESGSAQEIIVRIAACLEGLGVRCDYRVLGSGNDFLAWALNEYDERHEMLVVNYANRATIGPGPLQQSSPHACEG
jgi:hypothetical protein